ncbi:hypothetical protein NDU88_006830 [Pleurodeles waltl]|uniref:Uncharacterized protein n=1 Tax=Pleurodeles waltl TaxID=8319 RepID=A0AAV7WGS2_PLEWA|nr:hypothetical protein NDU88_006830 [Pleurodeles waltl]
MAWPLGKMAVTVRGSAGPRAVYPFYFSFKAVLAGADLCAPREEPLGRFLRPASESAAEAGVLIARAACRRPRPRAQVEGRADAEARNRFRQACGPGAVECLGAYQRLSRAVVETFLDLAALGIPRCCVHQEQLGAAGAVAQRAV